MGVLKCWKIAEPLKVSIKAKIVKHLKRPKQQSVLRKLFCLTPHHFLLNKILLRLRKKNFLSIQTFAFKVLQVCSSWTSRNGAVQMFFLTPNRNIFAGKFFSQKSFWLCYGSMLFSTSSELRFIKLVRLFEWNCIVK